VKNHDGFIYLDSTPGQGSEFMVYLPPCSTPPVAEHREACRQANPGTGTILVVDDEEVVRDVAAAMLGQLGYSVLSAIDGHAAVDYYRDHGDEIDLIVLDMVMPKMDGKACLAELMKIDPNVIAILSTGYGRDGLAQSILDKGAVGFVQKPYMMDQLSEAVEKALRLSA